MIVGNYNFHQILFALDTFKEVDEKIEYLIKIKRELVRIVACFEEPKTLPLKMYASKNINIEGSCEELKDFIKHQFKTISSNPYDTRYPGEGELRGLVRAELVNYQKVLTIIKDEIDLLEKKNPKSEKLIVVKNKFITLEKFSPHFISKLLKELTGQKIIWNSSIGELIDLVKIMIILELVNDLEEDNLPKFVTKHFVNRSKEKYTIPQIEKVHKMLQNTFWQNGRNESPKYFQ
ncbi:MAG: hypothetical protein L3J41_06085 [Melioribacteraceae bacterium]|nr:hypothetical protein [Melioribacteraceae bacterium]